MKAVHGIGKRSWWPSDKVTMDDNDVVRNPDDNGGFEFLRGLPLGGEFGGPKQVEMGKWLDLPQDVGEGAVILHTYTEPERAVVYKYLVEFKPVDVLGEPALLFDGYPYDISYLDGLIKLFSNPDDPPVYYMAG